MKKSKKQQRIKFCSFIAIISLLHVPPSLLSFVRRLRHWQISSEVKSEEERTIDSFCWISLHLSARTHSSLWERVLNILESWPGDVVEIANANNEFRWIEFFILPSVHDVHDVSWMIDLTWVANNSSFLFRLRMKVQLTDLSLFSVMNRSQNESVGLTMNNATKWEWNHRRLLSISTVVSCMFLCYCNS